MPFFWLNAWCAAGSMKSPCVGRVLLIASQTASGWAAAVAAWSCLGVAARNRAVGVDPLEDHGLAAEVGERHRLAVEVLELEGRRDGADRELGAERPAGGEHGEGGSRERR